MNSIRNLGALPAGRALISDDILEFHAARLLLVVRVCGISNRIDGLTKLAKLDFFVRYPAFFADACRALHEPVPEVGGAVEAPMVRYHYGPWDKRYYHVLAFLEGTRLLSVAPQPNGSYRFSLTEDGLQRANALLNAPAFAPLVAHMGSVKRVFGSKSGDTIKKLIYQLFDAEVALRLLGEVIR